MTSKKGAAGVGGGRPPRTRSGDGEGWGRDRERVSFLVYSARRRGGRCGAGGPEANPKRRLGERNPNVRSGLRLTLDEAIAGVRPEEDVVGLIVEDILAAVGFDGEHSM